MTTPATGNITRTDLYQIHHVVQNTLMSYPKEIVIGVLRDEFSRDSYYHYVSDEWGFPKVTDSTGTNLDAGINDDDDTRIFIGEAYRFDVIKYPALFVKMVSARSVPISMSRNKGVIEYDKQIVYDELGNQRLYFTPKYIDLAGAWEGTITIDVVTRDIFSRDELISIIMLIFTDIRFEAMRKAGVLIKSGNPTLSGVTEGDDRQQEKLYKATLSLDIRTEWRRLIPVSRIIEKINLCVDFNVLGSSEVVNPNIEINQSFNLLDQIESL